MNCDSLDIECSYHIIMDDTAGRRAICMAPATHACPHQVVAQNVLPDPEAIYPMALEGNITLQVPDDFVLGDTSRVGDLRLPQEIARYSPPKFQHGDIGACRPDTFDGQVALKAMQKLMTPYCQYVHHFVIADYVPENDDYVILESLHSGIRVGRLSWYPLADIFRVNTPFADVKGTKACRLFTRHGRAKYDYILLAKVLAGAGVAWGRILAKEHRLRKLRCGDLPYSRNDAFICTEVAAEISRLMGDPVIPLGCVPLPPAFQEAVECGKLVKISEGPRWSRK